MKPNSSNRIPLPINVYFRSFLKTASPFATVSPTLGSLPILYFTKFFALKYPFEVLMLPRYFDILPVLGEIDIPLSFKITITFEWLSPILFRAS